MSLNKDREPSRRKIGKNLGRTAVGMTLLGVVVGMAACTSDKGVNTPTLRSDATPTPTPTGCPENTVGIILYDLSDFKGKSLVLSEPGDYDMQSKGFNRMASSLCNPGKNHVTLRDNRRPSYYDESVGQLSGVDNNSADTVKVELKGK